MILNEFSLCVVIRMISIWYVYIYISFASRIFLYNWNGRIAHIRFDAESVQLFSVLTFLNHHFDLVINRNLTWNSHFNSNEFHWMYTLHNLRVKYFSFKFQYRYSNKQHPYEHPTHIIQLLNVYRFRYFYFQNKRE